MTIEYLDAKRIQGQFPPSWSFDGTNDYVDLDNVLWSENGNRTFSAWLYYNGNGFGVFDCGNQGHVGITGNEIRVHVNSNVYFDTDGTLTTNAWNHIVVTQTSTDRKAWINGVEQGVSSENGSWETDAFNNANSGDVRIAHTSANSYGYFDGRFAQVLFYDAKLSDSEIADLYNSGIGTTTPLTTNLSAFYNFEQTGSTLTDQSGNDNNGTNEGATTGAVGFFDDKATLVTAGTNSDWTSTTGWTFGSNKHTVNNSTASVTRLTYYDLGSNQPDAWVIRFKMAFTGWENNGSAGQGIHFDIGMVDDATSATMNNENITGLDSVYARLASGEWACQSTNGSSTLNYAQFNTFSRPYTATYWVEVRKLSTTQAQVKLWLSSDYDEDPDEESDVMTLSANPDCRYIFARLFYQSVTSDNTIDISEFEYYNSLSTVTPTYETDFAEPFSNLPENTIFNETDTYLQYWLQDSIWKSSFIGRGLFGGAYYPDGKSIKFITVQTTGTVTDFGDLTNARGLGYASASRDLGRALFAGGYGGSDGNGGGSDVNWQNIDYVNVHSVGDASDFGDLNIAKRGGAGFGSQTRAIFAAGYDDISGALTDIYYVGYATLGDASDFGDLAQSEEADNKAGASNNTRGLIAGGSSMDKITFITIDSKGDSSTFGDLSGDISGLAGCADETTALFGGGDVQTGSAVDFEQITKVTIASIGDVTDFGELLPSGAHENALGALSDWTYGVWGGGYNKNKISYVTIATGSASADWGADLGLQSASPTTATANWSCSGCAA